MRRSLVYAALLATALSGPGTAQDVAQPPDLGAPEGALSTAYADRPFDRYALPIGPFGTGAPAVRRIEGRVIWSAFKLDDPDSSVSGVMAGYQARLTALGYEPLFECSTTACGGFDFRFEAQLLPPPDMLIDTADFAQFSARRIASSEDGVPAETFASVLVSRLLGAIHIQTVFVVPGEPDQAIGPAPEPDTATQAVIPVQDERSLLDRLNRFGHVPVQGLAFDTGGAALAQGSAPALDILAGLLLHNPDMAVAIVGHSDNQGAFDANIALSQRRAEAVRAAMIERGVAADRLDAHGVGYLAPVANNVTVAGRTLNRRVELVLR
jgi:OOP family OmpA-OmpF porin